MTTRAEINDDIIRAFRLKLKLKLELMGLIRDAIITTMIWRAVRANITSLNHLFSLYKMAQNDTTKMKFSAVLFLLIEDDRIRYCEDDIMTLQRGMVYRTKRDWTSVTTPITHWRVSVNGKRPSTPATTTTPTITTWPFCSPGEILQRMFPLRDIRYANGSLGSYILQCSISHLSGFCTAVAISRHYSIHSAISLCCQYDC